MTDLMDRVLAAYLDDGWSKDDFPQELFQQQEALSRVVSLVIEEAAKVAGQKFFPGTYGGFAGPSQENIVRAIRSINTHKREE